MRDEPITTALTRMEQWVLKLWAHMDLVQLISARSKGLPLWSLLDGPVTANNPLGVHHARGRTIKDALVRHHVLRGYDVDFRTGYDCQGHLLEVEVEKELGIRTRAEIEVLGVAEFTDACRQRASRFAHIQMRQSIRLGMLMDWGSAYRTDSVAMNMELWAFLAACDAQGAIFEDAGIVPWCPRCEATLSEVEVEEGATDEYIKEMEVRFQLSGAEDEYLLVTVAPPWHLLGTVALGVSPDAEYTWLRDGSCGAVLTSSAAPENVRSSASELRRVSGRELVGAQVLHPLIGEGSVLPVIGIEGPIDTRLHPTGIVLVAPCCDGVAYHVAANNNLPCPEVLSADGYVSISTGGVQGRHVSDVEIALSELLRKRGFLRSEAVSSRPLHSCWRCRTPLISRPSRGWYLNVEPFRRRIERVIEQTEWIPPEAGLIERQWVGSQRRILISKPRYWGGCLPIWRCTVCAEYRVIGGEEQLRNCAIDGSLGDRIPVHRPEADWVRIRCECGGVALRVPEVCNTWLDAITPWSREGYREPRHRERAGEPKDLAVEALQGQYHNWFYGLVVTSAMLPEPRPQVRTVLGHGLVFDSHGREMHKSLGNAPLADAVAEELGADALRLYMLSHRHDAAVFFDPEACRRHAEWLEALAVTLNTFRSPLQLAASGATAHWASDTVPPTLREVCTRAVGALDAFQPWDAVQAFRDASALLSTELAGGALDCQKDPECCLASILMVLRTFHPLAPFTTEYCYQMILRGNASFPPSVILLPHDSGVE